MTYRERHNILAPAFDKSENEVVCWDDMLYAVLDYCMERGWQIQMDQDVVRILTVYGYVKVRYARGGLTGAILDAVALALRDMRPGATKNASGDATTHLWGE